jgi:hypothetical protein
LRCGPALRRPFLEALEDRTLLSTLVNTTADSGPGSLRQAILDANAAGTGTAGNPDLISFDIPTSDAGYNSTTGTFIMQPLSALPTITDMVSINGYSQPGSVMNTLPVMGSAAGDNAFQNIILDGSQLGGAENRGTYDTFLEALSALANPGATGLVLAGGHSTVTGLVVQNFSTTAYDFYPGFELGPAGTGVGIWLLSGGNTLAGNYFADNSDTDILVDNVPGNTIGGTDPGARNICADNVTIQGLGASANVVEGNYLDTDGSRVLGGATGYGGGALNISGASNNTVGGVTPGAGNVIGSSGRGIIIGTNDAAPTASGNFVQGNYIGVNAAGTGVLSGLPLGRGGAVGIGTGDDSGNTIGGTSASARNVIAGWSGAQVYLGFFGNFSSGGDVVEGNYIGTTADGSAALVPNEPAMQPPPFSFPFGIECSTSEANAVIKGNLVSGLGAGIVPNEGDVVQSNLIGTDATGAQPVPNGFGIVGGDNCLIGGTTPGAGNTIAFSTGDGVDVFGTGNTIVGNSIYGNGRLGIDLGDSGVPVLNDSQGHAGFNNFQNYPVLAAASSSSTSTFINGSFSEAGEQNQPLTLDFYANSTMDPSGYGQGQIYLGSRTVVTDGNGNASFSADFATGGNDANGNPLGSLACYWISGTATDSNGNTSEFSQDIQATAAPSQTFTQNLPPALPQSTTLPNTVIIEANTSAITDVVNGLSPSNLGASVVPVSVYLYLAAGTYSPTTVQIPINMTLYIDGVQGTQIDPASPALTLLGGNVVVSNITLVTTGNAPTILVTGGKLTLRNDTIEESSGFNDPAISISGGTLDLGTTVSPGGNIINVHVGGAVIQNSTSTSIPAVGDSFTANGAPLTPSASLSGLAWEDFNNDGQVDFGETGISGVTVTLTGKDFLGNSMSQSQQTDSNGAYVFLNLLPGNYTLTETPPSGYLPGIDSVGTAGGGVVASGQFSVPLGAEQNGLNYNFGEQPLPGASVQKGQTAGIGFWNNKKGQALILALNGGRSSHQLGDWLAATLPNIFGVSAGSKNLAGQSNAAVAALFQQDFLQKGVTLDAQLLATALNVYVTNATLDSTKVATSYGFTVSGDGVGTAGVNVGTSGDAFGVANNATLTVMDVLLAADAQALNGVLYGGNAARWKEANDIFSAVNQDGAIS